MILSIIKKKRTKILKLFILRNAKDHTKRQFLHSIILLNPKTYRLQTKFCFYILFFFLISINNLNDNQRFKKIISSRINDRRKVVEEFYSIFISYLFDVGRL